MENKTVKLALYQCISGNYETYSPYNWDGNPDYRRLSEWVEVEFPIIAEPLDTTSMLAIIDKEIADLEQKRFNLLAGA